MYEIYAYPFGNPDAELLIYQPGNSQATVLSPKLTREVSKGGSLTFTMTREHPQYATLQKMSTVVAVRQDGKEIWRGRILNHEADWYNNRAVYCEGALSYFNDSCVSPFNYDGTLKQFLQHLVETHNAQVGQKMKQFELGTITAALGDLVVHFGDADEYGVGEDYGKIWDIIDKMVLKTFGGYAYCSYNSDTGLNVLNYCDQAVEEKRQTAQNIEYGVNLLDLTEKTDTNDLYTRILPVGNKHTVKKTAWYYKLLWWKDHSKDYDKDHEERWGIMETDSATVSKYLPTGFSYNLAEGWIQNDAAVAKFGVIARTVDLDADSSNDLFAAGVQALQQNSLMVTSYTIRAVDLVDAGHSTERLTFACYSHIVSKPHSADAIMLCSKLVEPLDHPEKKEYTFGMTRRTLTDRQVENMGRTNLLDESASAAEKYSQATINQLFAYKKTNDEQVSDISGSLTGALTKLGNLQEQVDGNITSWFYEGTPTSSNAPAKNWTTDTLKQEHLGDLYYDTKQGLSYRWVQSGSTYKWQVIRDTSIAKALADAASAQAAADNKVRCFTSTPYPPYDVGDIWMQGSSGDIKRCQTTRASGSYNASDWVLGSKYTDDTAANNAQNSANNAQNSANNAQKSADNAQTSANNAQSTANQARQDAAEAAKTATNFISFSDSDGMIVGHKNLANKKVQITNDGVKVMDGSSMVNIRSNGISITDGSGSCSINSGRITFYGIKNTLLRNFGDNSSYSAQTVQMDLSTYTAVYLTFESKKGSTWWASGGGAGRITMVIPVNGQTYAMVYPWNTTHMRTVKATTSGIEFGSGFERQSSYTIVSTGGMLLGVVTASGTFALEEPGSDGWTQNNSVCMPRELYGFM